MIAHLSLGEAAELRFALSSELYTLYPLITGVKQIIFKLIAILKKVVGLYITGPDSKETSYPVLLTITSLSY